MLNQACYLHNMFETQALYLCHLRHLDTAVPANEEVSCNPPIEQTCTSSPSNRPAWSV